MVLRGVLGIGFIIITGEESIDPSGRGKRGE
jgi:hypothetical protein